jgi:hypothetical protein
MEEWKECYNSDLVIYYVSNQGRIKSIRKKSGIEYILKKYDDNGYERVMIKKLISVHKLVALYFIGEKPNGYEIDHINRIRNDNRVENLRYCTRQENVRNSSFFREDIIEEGHERIKIRMRECAKTFREKHKDKINEKYTCECGSIISKHNKAKHERSKKHNDLKKK